MKPRVLEELKQLKYRYCYHLDNGNTSSFIDLFTDDVQFEVPNYGEGTGKEDIREFIEEVVSQDINMLSHIAANPIIEIDGRKAIGKWNYIVIIEPYDGDAQLGKGQWNDEYRRVDNEWKISSLLATRQFTTTLPK